MTTYFVKTDYVYDSYADLFRLAELSGYPVISFDQVDIDSHNVYIATPLSGEWQNRWDHPIKAEMILLDLEWRLKESDYAWPESALVTPPFVSRVWASDRWYAERVGAQYVPIGSHSGLVGDASPVDCDVATLCYHSGRRPPVINALKDKGLSMAPNAWDEARDSILKGCQTVLHIHQHEAVPTVAPLRYALAAAWHKPLISEWVYDRGIFDSAVLYADYSELADYTALLVRRYGALLQAKADELHELLVVKNSFKSLVEAAL